MSPDRREFLRATAAALVAAGVGGGSSAGCVALTPRYRPPPPVTRPEDKLLLTGARIVDVERGALREESQVLVQDGRVAMLVRDAALLGISPDRRLDLDGAYLMPGLINAHVHMSLPGAIGADPAFVSTLVRQRERSAEDCIRHGVTTVRDMQSAADRVTTLKAKIARGKVIGPRILMASAMDISGGYSDRLPFNVDSRYWRAVRSARHARDVVRFFKEEVGADLIKLFHQPRDLVLPGRPLPVMPPKLMREIRRSADRWSLPVALHHSTVAGLEAGLAAGIRDLQHTVRDAPLTEAHLRAVVDGEVAMVPTLSVSWALAHERRGDPNWGRGGLPRIIAQRARLVAELFREFCEPRILASTLDFYRQFEDPDSYETWHLLPWPDPTAFTALLTVGLDNLRAWHRAGARLGCGNDGGVPLCFPGALALELRMLADAGLPAGDVLRMATADNARLLGLERTLGTVGQGKVADLLVLDDDPLEDPWHTYRPRMVFQSGRIVFWRDSAHRV